MSKPPLPSVQPSGEGTPSDSLERGRAWLEMVLSKLGMPATVQVNNEMLEIDQAALSPEQQEIWLGQQGATLDAMQYLVNTLLNLHQPPEQQQAYMVELGGYRQERQQALAAMVATVVAQVRATGQEVEMDPLSAAERRQVHLTLDAPEYDDLESVSRGKEPNRRLVIRPVQLGDSSATGVPKPQRVKRDL